MKWTLCILLICSAVSASFLSFGQNTSDISGQWLTEDRVTLEMTKTGNKYAAVQIQCHLSKDHRHNGKIIAKDLTEIKAGVFEGTVIDPDDGKSYKALWTLSGDQKQLTLKVKWGFVNYTESWKRI